MLIEAGHLRKVYRIHEHQATTLKEMVVKNLFAGVKVRDHVALEDVTFRLGRGRSLGVIGPNGSGKSTLLKLIAGIIEPTSGHVEVRGRVASLLELGAGFQPEFTGMENIFLQGRILGLNRSEILDHLDDIIEFSGLGDFIHTPTKRYSTGMIVRLGFAVAVFFDADILLIDEVLSVGDAAFQSRCIDRIQALRREGKSILFVSHDLSQVERVSEDILWLDGGKTRALGPADTVLRAYDKETQGAALSAAPTSALEAFGASLQPTVRQGTGEVLIQSVQILHRDGRPARTFVVGEIIRLDVELEVIRPLPNEIELWVGIGSLEGDKIGYSSSALDVFGRGRPALIIEGSEKGRHRLTVEVDSGLLIPGQYQFSFVVNPVGQTWAFLDMLLRMYRFQVVGEGVKGAEAKPATPVGVVREKKDGKQQSAPTAIADLSTPLPLRASLDQEPEEKPAPGKPNGGVPKPTPRPLLVPPAVWEDDA